MEKKSLSQDSLNKLLIKVMSDGNTLYAPHRNGNHVTFKPVSDIKNIETNYIQTTLSAKHVYFPQAEELFGFERNGTGEIKLIDNDLSKIPDTVLFGVRPCDAASIAALDAIFMWDYQDIFFKTRLEKTTVIAVSCNNADEYCFCTSVGGGPGDTKGSDILLTPLSDGNYLAEILTVKGDKVVQLAPELFSVVPAEPKESHLAKVKNNFNSAEVTKKLGALFDNEEFWMEQSLRCIGCGTCAFVCPACACFDIQDEGIQECGTRLRCWDSCGFAQFTLHTSGHNPRPVQSQRWRQRVMHKFAYMPNRLKEGGCVGCGRCSRACPVDMNMLEHVKQIAM